MRPISVIPAARGNPAAKARYRVAGNQIPVGVDMATLELPFWIVFDQSGECDECDKSFCEGAHLFTTIDLLVEHLSNKLGQHSQTAFVESRENLLLAVADLHHSKIAELDIDPALNEKSSSTITLREMLRQIEAA
jgi:hypothetical protein